MRQRPRRTVAQAPGAWKRLLAKEPETFLVDGMRGEPSPMGTSGQIEVISTEPLGPDGRHRARAAAALHGSWQAGYRLACARGRMLGRSRANAGGSPRSARTSAAVISAERRTPGIPAPGWVPAPTR